MGAMNLHTSQRQSQTLSPRLQQAVRLLQMSSADFAALLRDSLARNPFLEADEADGAEDAVDDAGADDADRERPELASGNDADGDAADELRAADLVFEAGPGFDDHDPISDRELWQADVGGVRGASDEGDASGLDQLVAQTSLADHLHAQLGLMPLSARDVLLARSIIESLDDDGYLRTPLEDLLRVIAEFGVWTPPATLAELAQALARVQTLEPAGVAARSVAECLQLQLPSIDCEPMRALAEQIVSGHLDALAARDVAGLARSLGATAAEVEAVCDRIRRLDPKPGHSHGAPLAPYVVPDVIVRKLRGQWVVQLNPAVVPRLRLNQIVANLYTQHRGAHSSELGAHLQEARWTLRNVDQRFSTILEVAKAIVQRQRAFLEFGTMAMKPLGLKEIADEVGVHESTVSRVTNNKFMATPIGVFELKYFFSRAMISANGSAFSATAIRSLIQDIIEAEDTAAPLSDADIARQLEGQGLMVARRTVTKYRQMLKIESVERRRRHG